MNVTIVDYQSGNISSVINSFTEVAKGKVNLEVTSDIKKIKSSDKIVLPGQGSFKSCVDSLNSINGLVETLKEFANYVKKQGLINEENNDYVELARQHIKTIKETFKRTKALLGTKVKASILLARLVLI